MMHLTKLLLYRDALVTQDYAKPVMGAVAGSGFLSFHRIPASAMSQWLSPQHVPEDMSEKSPADGESYWCFVSYRHADNKEQDRNWASWIHQEIERYEIPVDLVGKETARGDVIPERIYPVFRDEDSLPADADLSRAITGALDRSKTLLVLCSPRAVRSVYVAQEIRHFKMSGKADRIIGAILAGEPGDAERECFPRELHQAYGPDGGLVPDMVAEPIAADLRLPSGEEGFISAAAYRLSLDDLPPREAARLANQYGEQLQLMKLKIIAGILGVPLELLRNRDKAYQLMLSRKRFRRLVYVLGVVAFLGVLAAVSGVVAWRALKAKEKQRAEVAQKGAQLAAKFAEADFHQALATRDPLKRRQLLERSFSTRPTAKVRSHLEFGNLFQRLPALENSFPVEIGGESVFIHAGDHLYVNASGSVTQYDMAAGSPAPMIFGGVQVEAASPDGTHVIARGGGTAGRTLLKAFAVPFREQPGWAGAHPGFLGFQGTGHQVAGVSGNRIVSIDPTTGTPDGILLDGAAFSGFPDTAAAPPESMVWSGDLQTVAVTPDLMGHSTWVFNRRENSVVVVDSGPWRRPLALSDDGTRMAVKVGGDGGGGIEIHDLENKVVLAAESSVVDPVFRDDDMWVATPLEIRRCSLSSGGVRKARPVTARVTSIALVGGRTLAVGMEDGFVELLDPGDLSRSAGPIATHGAVKGLGASGDGGILRILKADGIMDCWTLDPAPPSFPSVGFPEQVISLRESGGGIEALTADNHRHLLTFTGGSAAPAQITRQPLPEDEVARPGPKDISVAGTSVKVNLSGVDVIRDGVRRYYPFKDVAIQATALDGSGKFLALGFKDGRLSLIDVEEATVMEPDWKSPDDISSLTFFPAARSLVVGTFGKCYFLPAHWIASD